MADTILELDELHTWYHTGEGVVKAVDGVSLSIESGRTVCVVGESGCGKSITARSILQLIEKPGRIVRGSIVYRYADGRCVDIAKLDPGSRQVRAIRGKEIAMIFQEPMSSLGPVNKIGDQLIETMLVHLAMTKEQAWKRSVELLGSVGIPNADRRMGSYSFELSGGMRQRVMIALALACDSRLLIADEPTTALDVTTQANILDLIKGLQREKGLSVMFITHDLGVVAEIADEVAVMYLGKIVERADARTLFTRPLHPYTRALLASVPSMEKAKHTQLSSIRGMVPHPFARPSGCPFSDRCEQLIEGTCDAAVPPMVETQPGHHVRCVLYEARP